MSSTVDGLRPDAPEPASTDDEASDAALLAAVRAGDDEAFGRLWSRHEHAARRLAGQLGRASEVDDLVSESFTRILRAIRSGGGPDAAFRPYLLSTLRRLHIDTGRGYRGRVVLTDDAESLDGEAVPGADTTTDEAAERAIAWKAWESLPASSRALLWHLIVEGETPAEIAPILGVSPNGVASRAVRAKERLRQAFITQHAALADEDACRAARARFGRYLRNGLPATGRAAVEAHLDSCARCRAAFAEISEVNRSLRKVVAPMVLGGTALAAKYLATTQHAAAATAASGGAVLASAKAAHWLAARAATPTGGALAGVAAVAAVVVISVAAGGTKPAPENRIAAPIVGQSGIVVLTGTATPSSKSKAGKHATPTKKTKSTSSSDPGTVPQPGQSTVPGSSGGSSSSRHQAPAGHSTTKTTPKRGGTHTTPKKNPPPPPPPPPATVSVTVSFEVHADPADATGLLPTQVGLSVDDGQITAVDGAAGGSGTYSLLPGTHTVTIEGTAGTSGTLTTSDAAGDQGPGYTLA